MTTKQPEIDAIVTCHNYGRYLSACLESLLRQTLPFRRIYLVDDASTDNTPEVARFYRDEVEYMRVDFRSAALAKQYAMDRSDSEFVVHVDADNWLLPRFNEELAPPLLEDPALGISYSGFHYLFEDEEQIRNWRFRPFFTMIRFNERILRQKNYIDSCSMFRRKAWQGEDPELKGLFEDWDRWLRMVNAGWKARLVKKPLFYYRIHGQGLCVREYREGKTEEAKRTIRRRHRKYDLTILTLFSGNEENLEAYLDSLTSLEKPEKTQLLFIDNSGSPSFQRRLKVFNLETICFPHRMPDELASGTSHEAQRAKAAHCGRLYRFAANFIQGRDVLVWEHDVLAPSYGYRRLAANRVKFRADLTGAKVISRMTGEHQAWRLRTGNPADGLRHVPVNGQVRRVFCTGFSFLLTSAEIFCALPMQGSIDGMPFWGCDLNAGIWAMENGKRWFVDGSFQAAHLDPDGSAAKVGHLKNVHAGPLLSFAPEKETDAEHD